MIFTPAISWFQSVDGKTLTLQDSSNWDDNDDSKVITDFTRQFVVKDSSGAVKFTLPLVGSALEVTAQLTKDQFFETELVITGTPNYSKIINIATDRFTKNLRLRRLNCNCSCKSVDNRVLSAEPYLSASFDAQLSGNGVEYDKMIDAAYTWLNS